MSRASVAVKTASRTPSPENRSAPAAEGRAGLTPPRCGIDFADLAPASPAGGGRAERRGNLPEALRTGIESLSGVSMDAVNVHYDSPRPRQLDSYAYAQGNDIHVGPGQERHLPHEAWHVVQQSQGRVAPTAATRDGVRVNDDPTLEREADAMGAKALAARRLEAMRSDETDLPPGQADAAVDAGPKAGPAADSTAFQLADNLPAASADQPEEEEAPSAEGGVAQRVGGPPTVFPSFLRILTSPTVQFRVHQAWLQTLAACTPTARREQGFWITWNSRWGSFSTTGAATGPVVGPADGATIDLPAKPADSHPTYTVASFHTHTPTTYRTVGRAVGPSGADLAADASDNVAGIVYDFWGDGSGNLPAGRSRAWPARLYESRNRRL